VTAKIILLEKYRNKKPKDLPIQSPNSTSESDISNVINMRDRIGSLISDNEYKIELTRHFGDIIDRAELKKRKNRYCNYFYHHTRNQGMLSRNNPLWIERYEAKVKVDKV